MGRRLLPFARCWTSWLRAARRFCWHRRRFSRPSTPRGFADSSVRSRKRIRSWDPGRRLTERRLCC